MPEAVKSKKPRRRRSPLPRQDPIRGTARADRGHLSQGRRRQYLIAAKERLAQGAYEDFVKRQLPFGASTARQIRAVAEAVFVAQRLSADELPGSAFSCPGRRPIAKKSAKPSCDRT